MVHLFCNACSKWKCPEHSRELRDSECSQQDSRNKSCWEKRSNSCTLSNKRNCFGSRKLTYLISHTIAQRLQESTRLCTSKFHRGYWQARDSSICQMDLHSTRELQFHSEFCSSTTRSDTCKLLSSSRCFYSSTSFVEPENKRRSINVLKYPISTALRTPLYNCSTAFSCKHTWFLDNFIRTFHHQSTRTRILHRRSRRCQQFFPRIVNKNQRKLLRAPILAKAYTVTFQLDKYT